MAAVALLATTLTTLLTPSVASAAPVAATFQNGTDSYTGATDTVLTEATPDVVDNDDALEVFGPSDAVTPDAVRSVIRWDISSIPSGSTITAASATFTVADPGQPAVAYPLLTGWTDSQATWNSKSTGTPWQTPGADGALDRGTTSIGTLNANVLGEETTMTLDTATVQGWLDDASSNHGFVLVHTDNNDGMFLRSSDYGTVSARPKLSITYEPPAPAPTGGAFVGITPNRVFNTRAADAPCVTGAREVSVAPSAGVPADAAAVALNVTVVGPSSPGYLTVYPTGATRPTASNLNYVAGQTVPNLVTTKVGTGGKVNVFASGGCPNVIVDVAGYYTAGTTAPGGFVGITPNRVFNTRAADAPCVNGTREVTVAPTTGVPADAAAVALNVTVVGPSSPGYLTVFPTGATRPTASSLNFVAGQTVPNHVTSKVGTGGKVSVFASGGCPNVVVDVAGYYEAGVPGEGGFVGITPSRVLNTRDVHTPCVTGTRDVTVAPSTGVPAGAGAVVLNVTVTGPTAPGYLTVYPTGATRPTASNLNYVAGQTVPNAVIAKVGDDGKVTVFASGGCPNVLIDVVGYHAGA